MSIIKPTVGRVLWFYPGTLYAEGRGIAYSDPGQPLSAMIAYVHSDSMVNITAWDQNGKKFSVTSVPLIQGDDKVPESFHCVWMPYQKGQAAKTEALEAVVKTCACGPNDVCLKCSTGRVTDASPLVTDESIEREIQAKGLTAPRITPADIESNIAGEYFFTAANATKGCPQFDALSRLTFCVLVLRNGFTVTGESACASPENFDAEIGRKIAREKAIDKVWPLMGYMLRERLYEQGGSQ